MKIKKGFFFAFPSFLPSHFSISLNEHLLLLPVNREEREKKKSEAIDSGKASGKLTFQNDTSEM